jgi:hypothetical protein
MRNFSKLLFSIILVVITFIACSEPENIPHNHKWGNWSITRATTCTMAGERQRFCEENSAHFEIEEILIDPNAHAWGEWTGTATCTVGGFGSRICNYNSQHTENNVEIGPLGHNYIWEVITPATLELEGQEKGTCTRDSSHIDYRIIPRLTINSMEQLISYLNMRPSNTVSTPYTIALNVDNLNTISNSTFSNKYVILDLSSSTITAIGHSTFNQNSYLTGIILPDSITSIGGGAFYYCNNLKTIKLPINITTIMSHTFYYCSSLESIDIPDNVTKIEYDAFYGCSKLERIFIPNNVTIIEDTVFSGCSKLSYVRLPSSLKTIKAGAFANCSSLKSIDLPFGLEIIGGLGATTNGPFSYSGLLAIEIPSTVTYIGEYAFSSTPLNTVTIHSTTSIAGNPFSRCKNIIFTIIGEGNLTAIFDNKALIQNTNNESTLICMPLASGVVIIPSGITKIGDNSFSNNTSLTGMTLPATVITIGDFAFHNCSNLNSVTLSSNLESIGRYAFSKCSLSNIIFPDTLKVIDNYSFEYNVGLTSLIFPQNLENINYYAFGNCFYIGQVILLNSTTNIDPNAFWTAFLYSVYNVEGAGTYIRDVPNGTKWTKIN